MLKGLGCFRYARNGFCVVALCHGKVNERDFYAFVAIEPQNYAHFKRRYRPGEAPNFHSFGLELLRGWGQEPPPEVLEYLKLKYGVEFGMSEHFLARLIDNAAAFVVPAPRGLPALKNIHGQQASTQ